MYFSSALRQSYLDRNKEKFTSKDCYALVDLTSDSDTNSSNIQLSCIVAKPNKMDVHPAKTQISLDQDSDQPGHPPNLIRIFAVRLMKARILKLPSKRTVKTDKTGRMPRLIWVFAGRTCYFVGFVMMRLSYCSNNYIQEPCSVIHMLLSHVETQDFVTLPWAGVVPSCHLGIPQNSVLKT